MAYKLRETLEAINDVAGLATYILDEFKNQKTAMDYRYDKKIESLRTFPFGCRGLSFEYRGYEVKLKPFDTYNIFFVVDV